uniref:DNA topoisomerase n=1 Tax=viral metagenome TaxID=1070528 RepID=A0A6C0E8P8_9ZZZZ
MKSYAKLPTSVIIVESPSKCKLIEKYTGMRCVATCGHLCEIASLANVNANNGFDVKYTILDSKKAQYKLLKEEIQKADEVILATDDDREGEAIAWHVARLFKLDMGKTKRILFHEITESALQNALRKPGYLNMNVVNAQRARQVLDLLVGYKISPMLWKEFSNESLSAGRCQTPALRIVYDKHVEPSNETNSYHVVGYFTSLNLKFSLDRTFENKDDALVFLNSCIDAKFKYTCSAPVKKTYKPPKPLTTSSIQQACSNQLHLSPKDTMRILQHLYESGYITYMRTDSQQYSSEFISSVKKAITDKHGIRFVNAEFATDADDKCAHEAIRPTNIGLEELSDLMDAKERKVYNIVWTTTMQSLMAESTSMKITAKIGCDSDCAFTYDSEAVEFLGWKIVSGDTSDEKAYQLLQTMRSIEKYNKIAALCVYSRFKTHLTEAKLVNLLEDKGIGRPSTFASLVDKIQERVYVKKDSIKGRSVTCKEYELIDSVISEIETTREVGGESNKLIIQQVGLDVIVFLYKNFAELFDYDYTQRMEKDLDSVSNGEKVWTTLCDDCVQQLDKIINKYKGENPNNEICIGKFEGHDLILKKGKFGLYANWGANNKSLKEFGNRPLENITFDEVEQVLVKNNTNVLREISNTISIRKSAKGEYIFYKLPKMKKPSFFSLAGFDHDFATCDIELIKSWVKTKYNIF